MYNDRQLLRVASAQEARPGWRLQLLALALFFLGVACFRSSQALRLATGDVLLVLLAVAIQVGSSLAAAAGVVLGRSWTNLALAAFGVGVLVQAVAEVFVYGTWALLPALGACLAVATALVVLAVLVAPALESAPQTPSTAR